jgi:hypothetical protein
MKSAVISVLIIVLLNFIGCSEDKTDKQSSKPEVKKPATHTNPSAPAPFRLDSPTQQELQPDLHISGVNNDHISGAPSTAEHVSGD